MDTKNLTLEEIEYLLSRIRPKVLYIDEDPEFGKALMDVAQRKGITLTHVQSVREAYHLKNWNFDVAIIANDLGVVTGVQLSNYLDRAFNPHCIVLTGLREDVETTDWPACIKGFVRKSEGAVRLIDTALRLSW